MTIDDMMERYPNFVGYMDGDKGPVGFISPYLHMVRETDAKSTDFTVADDFIAIWHDHLIGAKSGYLSDGASIPRAFWSIVGHPFGPYLGAAVIHDILYETQVVSRSAADGIFRDLVKALRISRLRRYAMYSAVRAAGMVPWGRHDDESIRLNKLKLIYELHNIGG
jgi:hypothetical protein